MKPLALLAALLLAAPAAAEDTPRTPEDRLQDVLSRFTDHIRGFELSLVGCQLNMTYTQRLTDGENNRNTWQIWRQDLAAIRLAEGTAQKGETTWRFIAPRRDGSAALAAQVARAARIAFGPDHIVSRIDWTEEALAAPGVSLDWRRFSGAPFHALSAGDIGFESEPDPEEDARIFAALRGAAAPFSIKLEAETRAAPGPVVEAPHVMFGEFAPPLRSPILTLEQAEEFGAALRDHAATDCPEALR
ncbi:hypothetical protein ACQ5SO_18275 [Rhodovulum sp. DZ06]|uniref:hypothetical protein n=1 Tax=Rhodovulum sp. DZ06 TaxID=3425126 RepID=UPI003D345709